jgi:hypothetical protein
LPKRSRLLCPPANITTGIDMCSRSRLCFISNLIFIFTRALGHVLNSALHSVLNNLINRYIHRD